MNKHVEDSELLSLAAKAADYWCYEFNCPDKLPSPSWNPLEKFDDAFCLAIKLRLTLYIRDFYAACGSGETFNPDRIYITVDASETNCDICAAACLAITRCAAEIGKNMSSPTTQSPNVSQKS